MQKADKAPASAILVGKRGSMGARNRLFSKRVVQTRASHVFFRAP
jgi:hypothetical protein